jgi:AcrR family transcriptional regulator
MTEEVRTRRPGRPAQISRDAIVAAAATAENLDSLTMRDLAARLGVSHGALYRWVANRDELFDLLSEVLVDRILTTADGAGSDVSARLTRLAWAVHDEFLALPGYATHLARPHRHHAHSIDRLRTAVVGAFRDDGVPEELADQSWQIFITCLVSWLAATENPLDLGPAGPPFAVFLDVLLRGLPARDLPDSVAG